MTRQQVETLWASKFGDDYTDRSENAAPDRGEFWYKFSADFSFGSFLEVGCNAGLNMDALDEVANWQNRWGCDVNVYALDIVQQNHQAVYASAHDLPFKDNFVDLAFTCGVLIHQGPEGYKKVVEEMFRVARKYVLVMEYENPTWEEIPYRGQTWALWKGPFRAEIAQKYGKPLDGGFLDKEDGFDRVTWSIFSAETS